MKGSYQIALNLANKLVEDCQNTRTGIEGITQTEIVSTYKQERAVILRLIGETQSKIQAKRLFDEALEDLEEALRGFEELGASKMCFSCLIQMSYLKNLLEDESGALAYDLQANELKFDWQRPGEDPFLLCFKALPDEYCKRHFNVRDDDAMALTSVSDVHLLNKGLKNPTASLHARHLSVMLKDDTDGDYFCKSHKEILQEALIAVETFLTCGPDNKTTIRAIIVVEELFSILFSIPRHSEEIVQLAEYVYLLAMYSEQLERVEQQLASISLCLWEQQSSRRFLMNELGIASGVNLDKWEDFSEMFTIIIRYELCKLLHVHLVTLCLVFAMLGMVCQYVIFQSSDCNCNSNGGYWNEGNASCTCKPSGREAVVKLLWNMRTRQLNSYKTQCAETLPMNR